MSRAAVSLATTQPRSSRPSTSGWMPSGSRAAYSVVESMNTRQKAPRSFGSTSIAEASIDWSGWLASRAVTRWVSDVASSGRLSNAISPLAVSDSSTSRVSSPVFTRLPLCASATLPVAVDRKVGCAFSHTDEPVVE